ncbi:uncharacterized protein [Lolium perenne]|uniref:uncharacterized protein n=1 Tax=Lolium perenne TaxID=4522 RepID=UPI003A9A4646
MERLLPNEVQNVYHSDVSIKRGLGNPTRPRPVNVWDTRGRDISAPSSSLPRSRRRRRPPAPLRPASAAPGLLRPASAAARLRPPPPRPGLLPPGLASAAPPRTGRPSPASPPRTGRRRHGRLPPRPCRPWPRRPPRRPPRRAAARRPSLPPHPRTGRPPARRRRGRCDPRRRGRRRAGHHLVPAVGPAPAVAPAPPRTGRTTRTSRARAKVPSGGPRAAKAKAASSPAPRKAVAKRRAPAKLPVAAAVPPAPAAPEVPPATAAVVPPAPAAVPPAPAAVSFMDMLNEVEVDINAPPLDPYRDDDLEGGEDAEGGDEEEEDDDDEDITEIQEEAFTRVRSSNYTDAEDILLVRAWASVGLDAGTGTDQTGKRYWQRIEDAYLKMKPKRSGFASRSFWSLQGRWDLMKPACARWSAAMDQVMDAPPSGTVESDYEKIAGLRYKEMAGSKGKEFPFKHVWSILQTYDKWKLRDDETAPKKSAMLDMDDPEVEERNLNKPEGTKKAKLRVKMEGEAASLREKMDHMMKAREALATKTLETKLLITEQKKVVKLAHIEAKREEAARKADLEERMLKVKEAKVWKELMVEEKEHMMMCKKDMDEEQLQWWKEYKEDIAERKRMFRGSSSTFVVDTTMSDGGVDNSHDGGV